MKNYYVTFVTGEKFNMITNGISAQEVVGAWQNNNLPVDNISSVEEGNRMLLINSETNIIEEIGMNLNPASSQYAMASVDGEIGQLRP